MNASFAPPSSPNGADFRRTRRVPIAGRRREICSRSSCSSSGLSERLRESEVIDAWKAIVGEFIAAHSCPVSLRAGVLSVRVLQPALHYQFEQISKAEILRKLKQRFGAKIIREIRFRVG